MMTQHIFVQLVTKCGKVRSKQSNLNRHIRKAHLKERNCKCDICGKAFLSPEI